MEELWKNIPCFEDYEVSNLGNVRHGSKEIKGCLDTYGYRQVNLYKNTIRYTRKVYRLVLEAFNPNTDNKPQIDHINRIRTDDRLENLRWVTSSENCRNKYGYIEDMHGITWNKKNSKYIVRFIKNGKETYFGSCSTLEEAKKLRDISLTTDTFIPQNKREMYGITSAGKKFRVRIGKNPSVYTRSLEEAKSIRDELVLNKVKHNTDIIDNATHII